jgi:N-acetylglutamate synthase-like GNAT family acetyltransferase
MIVKIISAAETWPIRQLVMWPNHPMEFVQLEDDDKGIHYGIYKDDELVSVVSCFEQDKEMQFRKFATLQHMQKQGWGSSLLHFILEEARKKGITKVWCNARLDKKYFYEKFGLTATDKHFIKVGILFTIMEIKFI